MDNTLIQASQILDAILQGKTLSHEDLIETIKTNICVLPLFSNFSSSQISELATEYEKLYGSKTFKPGITLIDKKGNDIWFFNKKTQCQMMTINLKKDLEIFYLYNILVLRPLKI